MRKIALITGIFGQDGSYLTELLYEKGYEVHGVVKSPLSSNSQRIADHLTSKKISPDLHHCDLQNIKDIGDLVRFLKPHEVYHLAATHYSSDTSSEARISIARELYQYNILSTSNIIHAILYHSTETKFVFASSCLMFDDSNVSPQNENTPFKSKSTYGLSKIAAAELTRTYREIHGLHSSVAVLYNHESPRRREAFVTQKIARNIFRIYRNEITEFTLGNLLSCRDWGYAKDYVYGLWLMAQQDEPDDYILATGKTHTVRDFLDLAFQSIGIADWENYVRTDENIVMSHDADLVGDASKAYENLLWEHSITFEGLVEKLVNAAIEGVLD